MKTRREDCSFGNFSFTISKSSFPFRVRFGALWLLVDSASSSRSLAVQTRFGIWKDVKNEVRLRNVWKEKWIEQDESIIQNDISKQTFFWATQGSSSSFSSNDGPIISEISKSDYSDICWSKTFSHYWTHLWSKTSVWRFQAPTQH